MEFLIVEKSNHLSVHGIFSTKERAELFLSEDIPFYVAKSYFSDKTLTSNSFEIIEREPQKSPRKSKSLD